MNETNLQPLGPDGIRQRMEEVRGRMRQVLGDRPSPAGPTSFSDAMASRLEGTIGGNAPLNPFGPGVSVGGGPVASADVKGIIQQAAARNGLDPALLDALVATESAYDPNARSRAGALGLSQLMPGTARELGVQNPFDPVQNVNGGAKYLASMIDKFGDVRLALAAYNAGPGAVERAGGVPNYAETQSYVQKVLALYEQRKAQ